MSVKIQKYKSGIYSLKVKQVINQPIEEIWSFFSSPKNLNELTPKNMNFKILSGRSDDFFPGKIISYSVNPFKYYNLKWVTEITHIEKNKFFIDEQRFGPYKMWHHKHFLEAVDAGTKITDVVHYQVPFGILGRLLHPFIIKPKLDQIFAHREKAIRSIFNI